MAARTRRQAKADSATRTQSQTDPLRLDLQNKVVWKGTERLELRPREFAVLRCLMNHAGELVNKDALYEAVWQVEDVLVGDDAITTCIYGIRQALGEITKPRHYIETRPKCGYCFIGPIANDPEPIPGPGSQSLEGARDWRLEPHLPSLEAPGIKPQAPSIVGREAELGQLHQWLEKALGGERQIVFVTGEVGIGKTTVVRAFLRQVIASGSVAIGWGQCIEHYGPGEAYLPVLEAVGRLCRDPGGDFFVEWMKQHAPTWLAQMPALLSVTDREDLQYKVQGATRERMLRELSEGLETLTTRTPLVLVLEDLHWSDVSTLDLLAVLARRQERAQLLVIGTYRPEELTEGHPLRAMTSELRGHALCQDLVLIPLSETAVDEYVEQRFPASALPSRLPQVLHQVTGGNPLFLVAVVDDLIEQGVLTQKDNNWVFQRGIDEVTAEAPENIRQLIGKQIDRLTVKERSILQAASIAGLEFSTAAVAAAAEVAVVEVEERCAALAQRQQFLQPTGLSTWPDGVRAARYRFRHALYQYLWNKRVTPHQWPQLHQKIGERLEAAYGNRASEIAAELAVHFEQGQDYQRAVRYLQQAGDNALRRSAYQEAVKQLSRGVELIKLLPQSSDSKAQELALHITLGAALMNTQGFGSHAVEDAYTRAHALCQELGNTVELLPALWGLRAFYVVRARFQTARTLAEQFLALAQQAQTLEFLVEAHVGLGTILFYLGDPVAAREHLEQSFRLYEPRRHRIHAFVYGQDPGVHSLSHLSWTLWGLGYADQAAAYSRQALALASESAHPFSLARALCFAAALCHELNKSDEVYQHAEAAIAISQAHGFAHFAAMGEILQGWELSNQGRREEGIEHLQHGLAAHRTMGVEVGRPYYLALLARTCLQAGQILEGLKTVEEAFTSVQLNGEQYYEAELYRLKGELILKSTRGRSAVRDKEAETYFLKAAETARRQSAKALELRAVMSLSRLWQQTGKKKQAHHMLAEIYNWFIEGFETTDLRAAKELLEMLS